MQLHKWSEIKAKKRRRRLEPDECCCYSFLIAGYHSVCPKLPWSGGYKFKELGHDRPPKEDVSDEWEMYFAELGMLREEGAAKDSKRESVFNASWLDAVSATLAVPAIEAGARKRMSVLGMRYYAGPWPQEVPSGPMPFKSFDEEERFYIWRSVRGCYLWGCALGTERELMPEAPGSLGGCADE